MYDYDDDDFDGRNARRRRRPWYGAPARPVMTAPARPYPAPAPYPAAPWTPGYAAPPPPPVVDRYTGSLKLGMMLDVAAQVLAAMASLPSAPVATRESTTDVANLIAYQSALAAHAKRDEQIRTAGALARLFLV